MSSNSTPALPVKPAITPERIEHITKIHDRELKDYYFWLREKSNEKVIDYIKAENDYCDAHTAHLKPLQDQLYEEFLSRIQQTDETVPCKSDNYVYYSKTIEGKQYRVYCRRELSSPDAPEQVLLDLNAIADEQKLEYLSLEVYRVSPNHKVLAYGLDVSGDEVATVYFKNLETGEHFPDTIEKVGHSLRFGDDDSTVFYTTLDESLRPHKVWRHSIKKSVPEQQATAEDKLVFHDPDERFFVGISQSESEKYLFITCSSKISSEMHYIERGSHLTKLEDPKFKLFAARKQDLEYSVTHHGDYFYIITNANGAKNFKLLRTPAAAPSLETAEEVFPYDEKRYIEGMTAFENHLVLEVREEGLPRLMIIKNPQAEKEIHYVTFPDNSYMVYASDNYEFKTNLVRIVYGSFVTPRSVFDYNMETRELTLKKEQPVLGGYDRSEYATERVFAQSRDGTTRIPVSLVYKKKNVKDNSVFEKNGNHPCLLYGYGSYAVTYDPYFNSNNLSLLNRGYVIAIASIRGGGENGRSWYENGKFFNKKNTFYDFIDSAKHLIAQGYTNSKLLTISGGSAGGLLMGAVINLEPELFNAALIKVPFVDCVNTMLDETIPLTVTEFEEWGNPKDLKTFEYMLSYAPYDNIDAEENKKKKFPAMLITSGLNDPRVQYWEPTKYTAKLRWFYEQKDPSTTNLVLLKTYMAGHSGVTGRYAQLKEDAFGYSFILDQTTKQQEKKE